MGLVWCDSFDHYGTNSIGHYVFDGDVLQINSSGDDYGEGFHSGSGIDKMYDGNNEGVSHWVIHNSASPWYVNNWMNLWLRREGGALCYWGGYSGVVRKFFPETTNGFVLGFYFFTNSSWVIGSMTESIISHGHTGSVWSYEDRRSFLSMSSSPVINVCDARGQIIAGLGFNVVEDESDTELLDPYSTGAEFYPKFKTEVKFGCGAGGGHTNNLSGGATSSCFIQRSGELLEDRHWAWYQFGKVYGNDYSIYNSHPKTRIRPRCREYNHSNWGSGELYPEVDWHHVEMKVIFHETNGSYEVRIDGNTIYSDTGINTLGDDHALNDSGEPTINSFGIGKHNWDAVLIQDLYMLDTNSPSPNDFLGEGVMVTSLPTANHTCTAIAPPPDVTYDRSGWDQGSQTTSFHVEYLPVNYTSTKWYYQQYDLFVGIDEYDSIITEPAYKHIAYPEYVWDECQPSYNYDIYLASKTQGDYVLFDMRDHPIFGTAFTKWDYIQAIQKLSALKKTDSGTMKLRHRLIVNGSTYDSEEFRIQDHMKYKHRIYNVSPDTSSSWTRTEVEELKFGLIVSTW